MKNFHAAVKRRLGLVYYYTEKNDSASKYLEQSYYDYKQLDMNVEAMKVLCSHAYIEELNGNNEIARNKIQECSEWLKNHLDEINTSNDLNRTSAAYDTYWHLYLYYMKLNQTDQALEYLLTAYNFIGKEIINKYHQHPKKDSHPDFFYCRDIINTYESSLRD